MPPTASPAEIKKAYRTLAARYHPDKHRGNELEDLAREKLAEINAAYEVLKDENRRAAYDRQRREPGPQTGPGPTAQTPDLATAIRSTIRMFVVMLILFIAVRFIRSPRALLVIGVVALLAWFVPRLFAKLKGRK